MTTRDYVYLGLIVLAAVAFYCNGFYAGVYRCKKMYDSLLNDPDADSSAPDSQPSAGKSFVKDGKPFAVSSLSREHHISVPGHDLRGDFRNN